MFGENEEQVEGTGAYVHRLARRAEHAFRGVELEGSDAYQVHAVGLQNFRIISPAIQDANAALRETTPAPSKQTNQPRRQHAEIRH
jgi:hypothetical protein